MLSDCPSFLTFFSTSSVLGACGGRRVKNMNMRLFLFCLCFVIIVLNLFD